MAQKMVLNQVPTKVKLDSDEVERRKRTYAFLPDLVLVLPEDREKKMLILTTTEICPMYCLFPVYFCFGLYFEARLRN